MTRRSLASGIVLLLAGTGLTIIPPATHAAPVPGWRPVHQTPAGSGNLEGYDDVSALGPKNAWAVGSYRSLGSGMRIARWNGTAWQPMQVPSNLGSDGGLGSAGLHTVAASSATNVWAFGEARRQGADVGFGIHWNGTKWTRKVFADGTRISDAATFGKQTLVLGSKCAGTCRTFVQRFDGNTWRSIPLPKASGNRRLGFNRLGGRSSTDVWVTGGLYHPSAPVWTSVAAHWNGKRWKVVKGPEVALQKGLNYRFTDVVAQGPANVWMSGIILAPGEGSTYGGLLAHWNGKRWRYFRINDKQGINRLAGDGQGGFWLLSDSSRALLHFAKGKVDRRYTPKVANQSARMFGLTRIPGTQSLWATGISGRRGTIWKYGP
ncbi:hypothetical protein SAMN04489712_11232 [Thermomonospora echinospora]|uniref:Photosynthesis system II assembly factor Ycf48/Hcf136-like domain-containing protein n=1 Tax=Thermomonospora echinospora TaxID=1992 RepID=A0A1H6D0K5_9ACTN|nr:hypothetical protein [Thermomonospora echinospora]SEG78126.1 hypothetical protein SAMN04489712_11232 [Thermomonospora echinospora]